MRSLKAIFADGREKRPNSNQIVEEAIHFRCAIGALQLAGSEGEVHQRKQHVDEQVACQHHRKELGPAHVEHEQVGMEVAPASAAPVHVEAAVLVDAAPQDSGELLR